MDELKDGCLAFHTSRKRSVGGPPTTAHWAPRSPVLIYLLRPKCKISRQGERYDVGPNPSCSAGPDQKVAIKLARLCDRSLPSLVERSGRLQHSHGQRGKSIPLT